MPLDADADNPAVEKIREIVVIPELKPDVPESEDFSHVLREFNESLRNQIAKCKKSVADTSAVSFMANSVQSRIVTTEICARLITLYEVLDVRLNDDFEAKLTEIHENPTTQNLPTPGLIDDFHALMSEWESFLVDLDASIEEVAGPCEVAGRGTPEPVVDTKLLVGHTKVVQSATLLAYIKNSAFKLMLVQLVNSFAQSEASDFVLKSYEKLREFQEHDCDVLLLKKGMSGGDGFLKVLGIPFKMILDEEQSLSKIIEHRQSALSIAGIRALHLFTEMICNDNVGVDFAKSDAGSDYVSPGGVLLVETATGNVLYNYACMDNSDWPDVDVVLEQVRLCQKDIIHPSPETVSPAVAKAVHTKPDQSSIMQSESTKATVVDSTNDKDMNVAVTKKKCCIIL